ncbi:hypothetical protein MNEG_13174, partial [Monoraphidium neglectum]
QQQQQQQQQQQHQHQHQRQHQHQHQQRQPPIHTGEEGGAPQLLAASGRQIGDSAAVQPIQGGGAWGAPLPWQSGGVQNAGFGWRGPTAPQLHVPPHGAAPRTGDPIDSGGYNPSSFGCTESGRCFSGYGHDRHVHCSSSGHSGSSSQGGHYVGF